MDQPGIGPLEDQNGGQVFYTYNISVNVDEEIGGEVKGCRLPGGGILHPVRYMETGDGA
jgi:hypothetical protein